VSIEVKELNYAYPGSDVLALKEVNLTIPDGSFFGIIGPNGSGKSTLCRALIGFVPHFYNGSIKGSIKVDGFSVLDSTISDLAQIVGFVFQNPFDQLTGVAETCFEEVAFGLEQRGIAANEIIHKVEEALFDVGLSDKADRHPYYLSGGQQQRLAIAAVLALNPKILVLDEATSQLDPAGTDEVFSLAKRLFNAGRTIVMVEHKLDKLALYAEQIAVLYKGSIVLNGSCDEVLIDSRLPDWDLRHPTFVDLGIKLHDKNFPISSIPVTIDQAEFQIRRLSNGVFS